VGDLDPAKQRAAKSDIDTLRKTIHDKLLAQLAQDPKGEWAHGMTEDRVCSISNSPSHTHRLLFANSHSWQAEEIHKANKFLTSAHIAVLANEHGTPIVVLQAKSKMDDLGSKVSITLYPPRYEPSTLLTRPQFKGLLKMQPRIATMHLDAKNTHFSAVVRDTRSGDSEKVGEKRQAAGKYAFSRKKVMEID
jgi:hypothetical protein